MTRRGAAALILLDAPAPGVEAAALLRGGALQDLRVARPAMAASPGSSPAPEALYLARVLRLLPKGEAGDGAAICALGPDQAAPRAYLPRPQGLREGDAVLLELRRWPTDGKAWPATRRVTLRSRRLALTPGAPGLNISRSISDEETRETLRSALRQGLEGASEAERVGCVARSAAATRPSGLAEEVAWLHAAWRAISEAARKGGAPRLLRAAPGPCALLLRDGADPLRPEAALAVSTRSEPRLKGALEEMLAPSDPAWDAIDAALSEAERDPFDRADIANQAWAALAPTQALPGGGALHLEPTRALVAVDVDAGDASALTADLDAASALPRLLRLRGVAGLIAVDFISRAEKDRRRVEQRLVEGLRGDPAATEILGWTAGGVLELRRHRARPQLTPADLDAWFGPEGYANADQGAPNG
ncbi:MAG: ribonuclease E/G [Pseudomonadota bacterium]